MYYQVRYYNKKYDCLTEKRLTESKPEALRFVREAESEDGIEVIQLIITPHLPKVPRILKDNGK